jgi:hypothetical protein
MTGTMRAAGRPLRDEVRLPGEAAQADVAATGLGAEGVRSADARLHRLKLVHSTCALRSGLGVSRVHRARTSDRSTDLDR